MILHILTAFVLGAVSIGAFTWRTLAVHRGEVANVIMSSLAVSLAGVFSTSYLIDHDWTGYAAFSFGSAAITAWMAARNRRRQQDDTKTG